MQLILHIGAHKTATTTIQRVLAANRSVLREAGIWYPRYSDVFPDATDHYAHLELPKGLMNASAAFDIRKTQEFFSALRSHPAAPTDGTVLISAEPFYRGVIAGDNPYWTRRRAYVQLVRDSIPFDDVTVVLVVRRQDRYLESLYNEHVKATRYTKDIRTFLREYHCRFEYRNQISLWSRFFPRLQVLTFEDLAASRAPATTFLEAVTGIRSVRLTQPSTGQNVSLPPDLVEFKRHLNGTPLDRTNLRAVGSALEDIARNRPETTGRVSLLSAEDSERLLTEFAQDNSWINDRYFDGRTRGLFPSDIEPLPQPPELDLRTAMAIVATLWASNRS